MPGSGSLVAGRAIGYFQLALAIIGVIATMVTGLHFLVWYAHNASRLNGQIDDPLDRMLELWTAVKWPLLAMGIFLMALLWALASSLQILAISRKNSKIPPRLT